jgi:hypothetical protein
MYRQIIEIEIECEAGELPAAIAAVAQPIAQIVMPQSIRQLADFSNNSQIVFQTPLLAVQKTKLLENKNG